jgi:hypothetical protein
MLMFPLALSLGSLLLFFLLYGLPRHSAKRIRSGRPPIQTDFDILERGERRLAIPSVPGFSLFFGGLFAAAFYWAAPVIVWRYGWRRALGIFLACIAIGSALGLVVATAWQWSDPSVAFDLGQRLVLGQVLLVPVRAVAGMYVARNDGAFRRHALALGGWSKVGTCSAASSRAAVKIHGTPVGPPKPRQRWWQRLRWPSSRRP